MSSVPATNARRLRLVSLVFLRSSFDKNSLNLSISSSQRLRGDDRTEDHNTRARRTLSGLRFPFRVSCIANALRTYSSSRVGGVLIIPVLTPRCLVSIRHFTAPSPRRVVSFFFVDFWFLGQGWKSGDGRR